MVSQKLVHYYYYYYIIIIIITISCTAYICYEFAWSLLLSTATIAIYHYYSVQKLMLILESHRG